MRAYFFTENDLEEIEKIIKVTLSIDKLYNEMYRLEINGKKDTEEYKKKLEYLNLALELESKQYSNSDLNYLKCCAWIGYLFNQKVSVNLESDMESITNQNYNDRVIRRILNTLFSKIIYKHNTINRKLPFEIVDLLIKSGDYNNFKRIFELVYQSVEIEKSFEKDIFDSYLMFLNEFSKKNEYKHLNEKFVNSKYNVSFLNKNIENNMISNNFDITDTLYINSKFTADILKIDIPLYYQLKNSYGVQVLDRQIEGFIKIGDIDYNDSVKVFSSVSRQCFIRAALLMMSSQEITNTNLDFHEFIENETYLEKHPNNKISEQLIINCFKEVKSDRKKAKVVSLKR